jgi:PAS domain S-box-containing protein
VLLECLAVLLTWFLSQAFTSFSFPGALSLLVIAILALAWGAGPSLLATVLGLVLTDYFLLAPNLGWSFTDNDLVGLAVFLLVGIAISRLASRQARTSHAVQTLATSLEGERARLAAILEAIPDPVTFYDAQGTLTSANPAGLATIGNRTLPARLDTLPREYHIRTIQGDAFPAEQLPVARALRGESVTGVEVLTPTGDGQDRILLAGAAPIRNQNGQIEGAVATSHDVTALRQAEQEAAKQHRQMQALLALTDTALNHLALDDLLRELLARLREVMEADNAAILLLSEDKQMLHMRVVQGPEEEVAANVHIPVGVGFAGRIAASRQPLIVEDLSTFDVYNPFLKKELHSIVGVPLLIGERVLGVAHVSTIAPRQFTEEEVQILQRAAERIALAVDLAALYTTAQAARAEAEERATELEAVIASITDGIYIYGPNGETRIINDAARAMMGFDARPGIERLPVQGRVPLVTAYDEQGNILPPERFPAFRVLHGETLDSSTSVDMRLRTLHGQEVQLNCTGAPIRAADGRQIGAVLVARNVTERRRLEQEVAERAQEFEAIFESMTDGVFVFDAQGGIRRVNAFAREVLGPEESNWQGRSMEERFAYLQPRDTANQVVPFERLPAQRVLRGEVLTGAKTVDLLYLTADGRTLVTSMSGKPMRDAAGAITGAVLVARDVTERRRLEREAAERSSQLEAFFDSMTDGLLVFDGHGQLVQMNMAARSLLGLEEVRSYSLDQASSESSRFFVRDEQGQPLLQPQWPISRILRGETLTGANAVDVFLRSLDEHERQVSISGAPVRDQAGAIAGAIAVMHDVTERRRLERRTHEALQALLDMARALVEEPDEVLLAEQNGAALRAVAKRLAELACKVIGGQRTSFYRLDPETNLLYPLAVVGLSPEQEQQWLAANHGHRLSDSPLPNLAERLMNGEVVVADMRQPPMDTLPNPYQVRVVLAAPLMVGQRMVGEFVLDCGAQDHTFTDQEQAIASAVGRLAGLVIERDRLLREREEARAKVLALSETTHQMDAFLSIVSHELRTPVTSIKTGVQILLRRVNQLGASAIPSEDIPSILHTQQQSLGRIDKQIARLTRLLDDLIDLSRIRSGKLEVHQEPFDLSALVAEVVESEHLVQPQRAINQTFATDKPVWALADPDRVGQVLTNYLTNALKYSPPDQPVEVGLETAGEQVRVWVRDHGPGIPPAEQAQIWTLFHRVPGIEVQSGSGIGLGLGLYISKTMIERQGGQVGVESPPGGGSIFWFTLSRASDQPEQAQRE